MSTEEKLKDLILSKYKSVREFTITVDIPYTTLDSIFKRGIGNSSVSTILKICNALHIKADALANGEIEPAYPEVTYKVSDADLNELYVEIGSMNTIEIDQIRNYAKLVKSKSLDTILSLKKIYDLDLEADELSELLKYAEFLKSKKP